MIISASRRTDIPAFYSEWLMNRIRAGFLLTRNPFNYHQISRVSLLAEDIDVLVFWTRNPGKLLPHLTALTTAGYRYYFQFTITGYPPSLEEKTPSLAKALQLFKQLSDKISAEKVIWRYDPILLANILPVDEHLRLFNKIAHSLKNHTRRVVISFADFYQKTRKNLTSIASLSYQDITHNNKMCLELAKKLAEISQRYGMEIYSCAENTELSRQGIRHGKCIDDKLINAIFNLNLSGKKDPGQREACGCIKSIDIGAYNTCLHGCRYCYATFNRNLARTHYKKHDPQSPFLLGGTTGIAPELLRPVILRQNLF